MHIREFKQEDKHEVMQMASKLLPDYSGDMLINDFRKKLANPHHVGFICVKNEKILGFITMSLRFEHVPKATTSPVAYIEAIFVKKDCRKMGIARKLYETAQAWAKSKHCSQMAADTWDWNKDSIWFHKKMGFEKTLTLVFFLKNLP